MPTTTTPDLTEVLLGGFAYFVESGTTIDGQPVSSTVKPDTEPPENWTAGTLGDILNFKFGEEKEDMSYLKPLATGGYAKQNRVMVTQDHLTIKTRQMGELVHRLQHGLLNKIALGTAQTPGLTQDRKIEGWLRLQGRQIGGKDRFVMDWWCEVRLEETGEFNNKIVEPVLKFTQIKGVAGNSVNYPS